MDLRGLLWCLLICSSTYAQIEVPQASPRAVLEQKVGLATLRVDYSRPSARDRVVFGNIVPYGRIWRVGANESTKFTTDQDLKIEGNTLPAGTYALYAFPEADSWEVVFHTNTTHWGDGRDAYDPSEDLFRIRVTPETTQRKQESFLITFDQLDHDGAVMLWWWDRLLVRIPIEVPTGKIMAAQVDNALASNPDAQTCYKIARYYQEEGIAPEKALILLDRAIALEGDTYYFHRVRSLVLAAQGDYRAAVEAAEKSMFLAEAEGKDEFVRMNASNLRKWKPLARSQPRD